MRAAGPTRTTRARGLRRAATRAELALWLVLRDRRLDGYKVVRQEAIGPYYVDFVCRERRLVIEVDGGQHADNPLDRERDRHLGELGYRVVRFWNHEVLTNMEGVLLALRAELEKPLTLTLSPQAGRGNSA